ncbi:hypothetical protein quinque_003064 [Culex quinquefasciatus]
MGTMSNFLASWSLLAVVLPLTLAHDVRPVDQDQTRFAALEEQDPQKVEEALLKLHFALLEDSRQKETGRQSYPVMNMSADISRNEFDYLVGRINEEVAVLRRQALILSKAYQSLLVKHKETTAKLDSVSSDPLSICANVTCKAPQASPPDTDKSTSLFASKAVQTTPAAPTTCNCNCQFPTIPTVSKQLPTNSESSVVGNKYYYFNYVQYPKYTASQQPAVESNSYLGHSSDPTGRPSWYDQTSQRPKGVRPLVAASALNKRIGLLHDLEQRLDYKINKVKQSYYDKYALKNAEKLYTSGEVEAMFDQWVKDHRRD